MAGTGEMVDGDHCWPDVDRHWCTHSVSSPVVIGPNSWLAARSTTTGGITLSSNGTAAANFVVHWNVPDRMIVAEFPARIVGPSVSARP